MAKFLKHLNLQICKYWYTTCCVEQTETHMNQPTEKM